MQGFECAFLGFPDVLCGSSDIARSGSAACDPSTREVGEMGVRCYLKASLGYIVNSRPAWAT